MPSFAELFDGIAQGAGDVARAGLADVQNTYQQVLTGRPAPMTTLTADMVYTSAPEPEPQSFDTALRTYSDLEQAEVRAAHEAGQQASPAPETASSPSSTPAPEVASHEPEV